MHCNVRRFLLFISLFSSQFFNIPLVSAAQTSDWSQYQGNSAHTGFFPSTINVGNIHQQWQITTAGPTVYRQNIKVSGNYPIVVNNLIYINGPYGDKYNQVFAIKSEDGSLAWKYDNSNFYYTSPISFTDKYVYFYNLNYPDNNNVTMLDAYNGANIKIQKFPSYHTGSQEIFNQQILFNPTVFENSIYLSYFQDVYSLSSENLSTKKIFLNTFSDKIPDVATTPALSDKYLVSYDEDSLAGIGTLRVYDRVGGKFLFDIKTKIQSKGYQLLSIRLY